MYLILNAFSMFFVVPILRINVTYFFFLQQIKPKVYVQKYFPPFF